MTERKGGTEASGTSRRLTEKELGSVAGGRGGAGNDVLIGGRGNDIVLGQDGSDLLIWNNGDGSD